MNVRPTGLLAVSDEVRRRFPVLRSYVRSADGRIWTWDSVPAGGRSLLDDYRLLQYDVLLGERYALGKVRTAAPR